MRIKRKEGLLWQDTTSLQAQSHLPIIAWPQRKKPTDVQKNTDVGTPFGFLTFIKTNGKLAWL